MRAEALEHRPAARLTATGNDAVKVPGMTANQMLAATLAFWTHSVVSSFLLAFIHDRLGLQLFPYGARCEYTLRASGMICQHELDRHGIHAQQCCSAMAQARHHSVRDWLVDETRTVRWHACAEQDVRVAQGPMRNGEDYREGRGVMKRADLLVPLPAGVTWAIDVAITSSRATGSASVDTARLEGQKRNQYGVGTNVKRLIGGEVFFPFVLHTMGGPGPKALEVLGTLAKAKADVTVPGSLTTASSHFEHFQQLSARLGRLLIEQNYRVLRAAGRLAL